MRKGFDASLGYPGKRANRPAVEAGNVRRWLVVATLVVGRSIVDPLVEVGSDRAHTESSTQAHLLGPMKGGISTIEKLLGVYVEGLFLPAVSKTCQELPMIKAPYSNKNKNKQ